MVGDHQGRSGGGNGIAPVTPLTPPDVRSSASGGWTRRRLGRREIGWDAEAPATKPGLVEYGLQHGAARFAPRADRATRLREVVRLGLQAPQRLQPSSPVVPALPGGAGTKNSPAGCTNGSKIVTVCSAIRICSPWWMISARRCGGRKKMQHRTRGLSKAHHCADRLAGGPFPQGDSHVLGGLGNRVRP